MSDADPDGRQPDPYRRHRFAVDVDGLPELGFAEVAGLEVTVEDRPAGPSDASRERPWWDVGGVLDWSPAPARRRRTTSPNLELWRGVTDDPVLWRWLRDWVDGRAAPRTVRVYLLDGEGERAVGWVCRAATPVAWTGPDLAADAPGAAMERLELAHEGIGTAPP